MDLLPLLGRNVLIGIAPLCVALITWAIIRIWLKHVDGATLLRALFTKIAPGKADYQKTAHSVYLTEWLIANDPDHIKELTEFVLLSARTNLKKSM